MLVFTILFYSAVPRLAPQAFGRIELASQQINDQAQIKARGSKKILQKSEPEQEVDGITARIILWKSALNLFKNNPVLGVGTGDIKDELMQEYLKFDFQEGVQKKFNCHNQYLQFAATLGIIGILVFLMIFVIPLKEAYQAKNIVVILFLMLVLGNVFFESMLETNAGLLFFCFFYPILINF